MRRQPIAAPPDEPVEHDDDQGHDQDAGGQHGELRPLRGLADRGAQPEGREGRALVGHVLRDDARVPGAARRRDPAGHQVGEDRRQVERPEALPAASCRKPRRPPCRSAGRPSAPAMTLKRMYHCVPSSIRTMLPIRGERRRRGRARSPAETASAPGTTPDLHHRLEQPRQPRRQADGQARRHGPQRAHGRRHEHPAERQAAGQRQRPPNARAEAAPAGRRARIAPQAISREEQAKRRQRDDRGRPRAAGRRRRVGGSTLGRPKRRV